MVNNLRFLAKWSRDISRDLLTQYLYFKMLRTMSSLCVPNVDSAPSSMPNLWQIIHFPQANALVPGLNLLEYIFSLERASQRIFFVVFFWFVCLFVRLTWLRKGQGLHRLRLVASVHKFTNSWWCRIMSHTDRRSQPAPSLKYIWLIFLHPCSSPFSPRP